MIACRITAGALALGALLAIAPVHAQRPGDVPRIGVLALSDIAYVNDALREGLRDHGYVDGTNVHVIYRSAGGDPAKLAALARELVAQRVSVLVAMGSSASRAAKDATGKVPIVMAPVGNPVESGLVSSLSRPGGNITGVSSVSLDLAAKRIALAKELLPDARRVAVLLTTSMSSPQRAADVARAAGRTAGVEIQIASISVPGEIDAAFDVAKQWRADALVIYPSPIFNSERIRLSALALRHRLAVIGEAREFADAGFVVGYGPSIADATRRAMTYVDKILKGANPGELAIEQPTKYDMTVNLRTAKALAIVVPQSLLARADEVIQ